MIGGAAVVARTEKSAARPEAPLAVVFEEKVGGEDFGAVGRGLESVKAKE